MMDYELCPRFQFTREKDPLGQMQACERGSWRKYYINLGIMQKPKNKFLGRAFLKAYQFNDFVEAKGYVKKPCRRAMSAASIATMIATAAIARSAAVPKSLIGNTP
eukprot:TRINITY_DN1558_c0_g1_i3.p2 TRINITY_DN1558_c0_g1~~TRINITY_DN1558_c0_g1_i3.p2  ORF type:complete len:106 (+),score=11.40 TRINITY_DN1558_c0_g1_i3:485-802(+)